MVGMAMGRMFSRKRHFRIIVVVIVAFVFVLISNAITSEIADNEDYGDDDYGDGNEDDSLEIFNFNEEEEEGEGEDKTAGFPRVETSSFISLALENTRILLKYYEDVDAFNTSLRKFRAYNPLESEAEEIDHIIHNTHALFDKYIGLQQQQINPTTREGTRKLVQEYSEMTDEIKDAIDKASQFLQSDELWNKNPHVTQTRTEYTRLKSQLAKLTGTRRFNDFIDSALLLENQGYFPKLNPEAENAKTAAPPSQEHVNSLRQLHKYLEEWEDLNDEKMDALDDKNEDKAEIERLQDEIDKLVKKSKNHVNANGDQLSRFFYGTFNTIQFLKNLFNRGKPEEALGRLKSEVMIKVGSAKTEYETLLKIKSTVEETLEEFDKLYLTGNKVHLEL